jgi:N6-L-threonylcarbamoyladenine synthase
VIILAIESSCDESAAALLRGTGELLSSVVASQIDLHSPHGGVVPELASRNHLLNLPEVVTRAFSQAGLSVDDLSAVAATHGPGLAPALLVGLNLGRGIAVGLNRPFYPVNHMEGHLLSPFFGEEEIPDHLGLVVSGGHTLLVDVAGGGQYTIVGRTRDDAAGEAFDKAAKMLGLPYPGGAEMDRLAEQGDPARFVFPRGMLYSGDLHFSFSGLKTSLRVRLEAGDLHERDLPDLCASFREAVVETLFFKSLAGLNRTERKRLAISGGVAANRRLRQRFTEGAAREGFEVFFPTPALCTDNAAMVAYVAAQQHRRGVSPCLSKDILPSLDWPEKEIEQTSDSSV